MELEVNKNCLDKTTHYVANDNHIMVCPPTSADYWMFRVKLHKDQAVLGFPKYGLIGVGFAIEKDWNTNLPTNSGVSSIVNHIKHNRKYKAITDDMIKEAVELIIEGKKQYIG